MLTRRLGGIIATMLILAAFSPSAQARGTGDDGPIITVGGAGQGTGSAGKTVTTKITNKRTGVETVVVHGGAGVGSGNNATIPMPDPCSEVPVSPQPEATSPWWGGHTAAQGRVVRWVCTGSVIPSVKVPHFVANGAVSVPPPVDPELLARYAEAQVETLLPPPSLTVSPDLPNNVDRVIGFPVTYVNLWFWYWADPEVWQSFSNTATLNGVSATTTARPVSLTLDPGDGAAPVVCGTAGRPWTVADGDSDPNTVGGCGYRYRRVTPLVSEGGAGPITARLSLTWQVTWTSTTGAAGSLDPLATTTDTPPFVVEQIRVVTK